MTDNLLRDDHAEVGDLFKELDTALGSGDSRRAFAALDLVWARLAVHIRAEHLCLFPAILDAFARVPEEQRELMRTEREARGVIAQLREDHNFFMNEIADAVKTMRELLAAPDNTSETYSLLRSVRQKMAAVSSRLEAHNKLEEEQVYRWPSKLLNAAEQAQLMISVRGEIENLPPRFNNPEHLTIEFIEREE